MAISLTPDYFDAQYDQNPDPWRISQGWYEQRKRALAMAGLPRPHYRLAFEPGCGNGELTGLLADRCDRVLAWDVAGAAVKACSARMADVDNVEVSEGHLPEYWPSGRPDLIVMSEFGYYLSSRDLDKVIAQACACLEPGGTLLAVHWRHEVAEYPLGGDDVHAHLFGRAGLARLGGYADDDLRMDVFVWSPSGDAAPSVAQQSGVL